jgi:hypothetical protein
MLPDLSLASMELADKYSKPLAQPQFVNIAFFVCSDAPT